MSDKKEIKAEVHRSVLCMAIGQLTIHIGWRSAQDELKDRVPYSLHSIVDDVLANGHISPLDLLRAFRMGALRPVDGTIKRQGHVVNQLVGWLFIATALSIAILIGHQTWEARELGVKLMGVGFIAGLGLAILMLCAKVLYPQLIAARVERFLSKR